MNFTDADLRLRLDSAAEPEIADARFGLIAMDRDGRVLAYNRFESELSGLSSERVMGKHVFSAVAPCTNNYLVAQRFESETELDESLDYVFTLKMRPTKVTLRLLKSAASPRMYLLVARR